MANIELTQRQSRRSDIGAAIGETIPVGIGMACLGIAFGLLVVQSGFDWWWTVVFTGVIFAGSLEFLLVGMFVAVVPLASIALTTLLVNFRHVFYGLSFPLGRIQTRTGRAYAMFALIDEAYALLGTPRAAQYSGTRIVATQLCLQGYWVGGGVLGALAGSWLPRIEGLEFSLTALFTILAIDACRASGEVLAPLLAVGCGLLALWLIPGQMLMVAMTAYVVLLLVRYSRVRRGCAHA